MSLKKIEKNNLTFKKYSSFILKKTHISKHLNNQTKAFIILSIIKIYKEYPNKKIKRKELYNIYSKMNQINNINFVETFFKETSRWYHKDINDIKLLKKHLLLFYENAVVMTKVNKFLFAKELFNKNESIEKFIILNRTLDKIMVFLKKEFAKNFDSIFRKIILLT